MNTECNDCGCSWSTWLYTIFRIIVGGLFLWHGVVKFSMGPSKIAGFLHVAPWLIWLAAIIEVVGGALIVLGLFTHYAAAAGAIDMLGAWFLFHIRSGWNPMANGGEAVLLYLAAMLALYAYGAGRCALSNMWCNCECDCGHEHSEAHAHEEVLVEAPKAAKKSKKRK